MKPPTMKCAIYTRKSSDEGLEQEFNSLDAQREACLAYITSQKAEGWMAVNSAYNDGGFSGGNMQRPGLQALLEDIKAQKVNIVVVYKIDRLTRSLMDFAKLVEVFDQHQVTFVSVTQSFNTTTSMGRLTLNMLLSFAQFEREVTGERIRDKISASKKKGMWMGGTVPLGYDPKERDLIVNEAEAQKIRHLYEKYLEFGSVPRMLRYVRENQIKGKGRYVKDTGQRNGCVFSRGALYKLLTNPLYNGKIVHKGEVYEGRHPAIIPDDLWNAVQERLVKQAAITRGMKKASDPNLLRSLMFSRQGILYSPVFTKKHGKRYRYYVSQNVLQFKDYKQAAIDRLPAHEIEEKIEKAMRDQLSSPRNVCDLLNLDWENDQAKLRLIAEKQTNIPTQILIRQAIKRIEIDTDSIAMHVDISKLSQVISDELEIGMPEPEKEIKTLQVPYLTCRSHQDVMIVDAEHAPAKDPLDLPPTELKNLIRGTIWRDEHFDGLTVREIAERESFSEAFIGRCIFKSLEV